MKEVLIVMNDVEMLNEWHAKLCGKVQIISALSNEEAIRKFALNRDVSAIAVGTSSGEPNAIKALLSLVRMFRHHFEGPIIPISALGFYRQHLIEAGCGDYECSRESLPKKILEILGL